MGRIAMYIAQHKLERYLKHCSVVRFHKHCSIYAASMALDFTPKLQLTILSN